MTVREIEGAGFQISERIHIPLASSEPESIARAMGETTAAIAQVFARARPDILLVIGDRYEMHAAAVAAVPFRIPIAHVHGGEITLGAIDEAFRHAITKYSHVHFVSTEVHGRRVVQLGEEPWRVVVSGAPGLDNLSGIRIQPLDELEKRLGSPLTGPPVLVTFHPVTLEYQRAGEQIASLLAALEQVVLGEAGLPVVITKPNADTNNAMVLEAIETFGGRHANVRVVDNLGTQAYFSLMHHAAAMVGNSSSGIIEAASFMLPVVDVGIRQHGRPTSGNVIHVTDTREAIAEGIRRALSPEFRRSLERAGNVYGDGRAAARIVRHLRLLPIDDRLLLKRFHDLPSAASVVLQVQDAD